MNIPQKGMDRETIMKKLGEFRSGDMDSKSGKIWGYVYSAGKEAEKVSKEAYLMYLSENALDPTVYPSMLKMETEIIGMARSHLQGDDEVVGNFTSGGTESCILAVKTARDRTRALKPHIKEPEMILPITGHACFHKAGKYLGVKPVVVPVDPETFKVKADVVREAITDNTILLVGSAPSYAHGVVDPIPELGQLALEKDLMLHVDGCIGAFLLPYFRRLGEEVVDFDFTVPGVTSISMDLHKYGFAAKGASVIMYRNKQIRQYQIFSCSTWTGYTVINSTIQSSRTGGPIAAAWAVLNFLGDEGYMELARSLRDATRKIIEGVEKIDGLRVLGKPEMTLIPIASDGPSVFHIADEMLERDWYIQPQLRQNGYEENFHLSVSPPNVPLVDQLLVDLKESVESARKIKPRGVADMVKEGLGSMSPDELTDETLAGMLDMAGMKGFTLPDRMADINQIMNVMPREIVDRLLVVFFNEIFR
ncbi:MAG: aspartate aminotransferase family protein [Pseudomonadota bacterium]